MEFHLGVISFLSLACLQGDGSPHPVGSRCKAPVGNLGNKVSQKLKQFSDIVYIF